MLFRQNGYSGDNDLPPFQSEDEFWIS